ncbi:ATP-binding protein, partial [Halobacterium salinarum]|nr:ATP-binding protein [Halobacterium salinarum]
ALAALAVAAHAADSAGRSRLTDADIEAGIQDVPRGGVVLGRPLAVSDAKQRVLAALLDTDATHGSVTEAADAVTATPGVSLSQSTVTRLLYELSGDGIVERVRATTTDSAGRPPSRVAVRFAPTAFRRLRARA